MAEITYDAKTVMKNPYPQIKKLGAVNRAGEMTPFVWKGRLMRMELWDDSKGTDNSAPSFASIRDVQTGKIISNVGHGGYFFSAYVEDDTVYVLCVGRKQKDTIYIHKSTDLIQWESRILLQRPGWNYFNTALTKGPDGYVLILEAGDPEEYVGVKFTFFFATSPDLVHWTHMDPNKGYSKERYCGGLWMRYVDGWYYVIAVTELPCQRYTNYIYRTKDFDTWYVGYYNPILISDNDDRKISPNCTETDPAFFENLKTGFNISNSDIDMCDWNGKTYMNYLVGNQLGFYYMAEAEYDGTVAELLASYFE